MQRNLIEDKIHRAVVEHLRTHGVPGLVFLHPANNPRSARDGARLKRLGARAGAFDLIMLHQGKAYALEIKRDNGRLTEEQDGFACDFNAAGGYAFVGYGLERCLKILKTWGLVKGRLQ